MSYCYSCGSEVDFRHMGGRVIPIGCQCSRGGGARSRLISWTSDAHYLSYGIARWPWPLTYPTACRECGEPVFYHTNGHGDSVLFDDLGPPWPVHWCWLERQLDRRRFLLGESLSVARTGITVTSERHSQVPPEASVPDRVWERLPKSFGPFDVVDARAYWQPQHGKPPRDADPNLPGPFLILSWIMDIAPAHAHPLLTRDIEAVAMVVSLASGHTVVLTEQPRKRIVVGTQFSAIVTAVGGRGGTAYMAIRWVFHG